ncbi:MAG: hypothetical protein ACI9WU_001799 [Myxococcota bacterium]
MALDPTEPTYVEPSMRSILLSLLAIAVLLPANASAKCAWTWLYSPHETTSPNGWLVLEGGGEARDLLRAIATSKPALIARGRRIPAVVQAVHDGQMNVTQVLLKPSQPLIAGTEARLELTLDAEIRERHAYGLDRLKWTVEPAAGPARFDGKAQAAGGERQRFGCGPGAHIEVATGLNGDARGVLAEVRRADGKGEPVRWLFRVRKAEISIGHGMCSGPVKLEKGARYTIRVLGAVDTEGQLVPAPGRTVRAKAP